ncbi:MAG: ceramidase [Rudanella sp.]|nr:ceramidase [Rudanella sp.]
MRQPGNTVSNLGFILVAILIVRQARSSQNQHLLPLAYISLFTGIGSAFFRASETWLGGFLDFSGIYLGASYMIAVNTRRLTRWGKPAIVAVFVGSLLFSVSLLIEHKEQSRNFYALESFLCCVVLEMIIYFTQPIRALYRWVWAFWGFFALGYGFWILDIRHIICEPANHWISGHALWHWFDAAALYCVYR